MIDALRTYLADVRKQRGMSQAELARIIGTQQSAVSELESCASGPPNIATLAAWADALGVTLTIHATTVHTFPVGEKGAA